MSSEVELNPNDESQDPYKLLGLQPGATFDQIKKARDQLLETVGNDLRAKAKIEASYDALLMSSLKDRQLGKISNAAVSASKREDIKKEIFQDDKDGGSILTRFKISNPSDFNFSAKGLFPTLTLPEGQALKVRFALAFSVVILFLIVPSESIELILSLSTISLFISQIKRGRKPLPSLGWSVVLLSIGLIIGGLFSGMDTTSNMASFISKSQLEAFPALILIWLGVILLD